MKPRKWATAAALATAISTAGVTSALADCGAAAQRVVAETGGQLLSVQPTTQGGQAVCKVTVLVQGSGNERPRKVTETVPE